MLTKLSALYNWAKNQNNFNKSILYKIAQIITRQQNREQFAEMFSDEPQGKAYAIADQYFSAFNNTPDYHNNLEGITSLDEVINLIRESNFSKPQDPLDILKTQYPQVPEEELAEVINSGVPQKYYPWIMKIRLNEEQDPMQEILAAVKHYEQYNHNFERDLNSFNLLSELRDYFDEKLSKNKENFKQIYLDRIEDHALNPRYTDYIYESDNFIVVLSGTTQSSQYWASGTNWCTGSLEGNMFSHYSGTGKNIYLYYVITKPTSPKFENPKSMRKISVGYVKRYGKAVLLLGEHTTVNVDNHELSRQDIVDYLEGEASAVFNAIESDLASREDTKFNELQLLKNMTVEEFNQQMSLIDDNMKKDMYLNILSNKDANVEVRREISKSDYLYDYVEDLRLISGRESDPEVKNNLDKIINGYNEELKELEKLQGVNGDYSRLVNSKYKNIRKLVAENPNTPPDALIQLAGDEESYVRVNVAANPNTPEDILTQLAGDKDSSVRRYVAENRNTPPEALMQLAGDENSYIRVNVVENPNVPLEILIQLAGDKDSSVRRYVAENPKAPPEALIQLAGDEDRYIRVNVAANPNAPLEVLRQLSRDREFSVRSSVARNSNVPLEILIQLAGEEDGKVRRSVAKNPNVPLEILIQLAGDEDRYIRSSVAANPNVPLEILTQLAGDKDSSVRRSVVKNPVTPPELLMQLAGDKSSSVRSSVAINPNTPADILIQLAGDEDRSIRSAVAENPKAPPESLIQLAGDEDRSIRSAVAENPKTPPEALIQLAGDEDHYVRMMVVRNKSTPVEVLKILYKDKDKKIRRAARSILLLKFNEEYYEKIYEEDYEEYWKPKNRERILDRR